LILVTTLFDSWLMQVLSVTHGERGPGVRRHRLLLGRPVNTMQSQPAITRSARPIVFNLR